jgi:photosystem II stability/assembly factor-like uncharacterized protein
MKKPDIKRKLSILWLLLFISSTAFLIDQYISYTKDYFSIKENDTLKEPEQGDKDDPFAAARFRWEMVTAGRKDIDPIQLRNKAIQETKLLEENQSLKKVNSISWSAVGPGNIGGRIRSIIINSSNSNQILIGSVSGGIWKTTNGGSSWTPKLDTQDPISIGSMVLVGSSTVYAGTGEGWWNTDAVYGGGIYKSTDFGDTWSLLSSTIGANIWNFRNVLRMDVDPSGNVYAVTKAYNVTGGVGNYYTNGGLFRTTDGGTSWTKISQTTITNYYAGTDVIAVSSSVILFSTDSDGIYRTTNSGTTWTKISSGLPSSGYNRIAMARDPNNSSIIYAVFSATSTGSPYYGLRGIFRSTNSGATWTALTNPPRLPSTSNSSYLGGQGWYDNIIAVDPFNSNNIYAGGVDMVKSTNGGSSWFQLTYWNTGYGNPYVHADHHAIAFDPNNSGVVYGGNDGGIYKSINGGSNWTAMNNGLEITQFYGGAVYPSGNIYYGGTQDNGHLKFSSGTSWTQVESGDGGYAAQSQVSSTTTYEEYVYLWMEKSTNGGTTWSNCYTGISDATNGNYCLFISPFSMDPENSSVLIAGSDNVWITSNSAGSWTSSSNTLSAGAKVSAVTVVNASANYLGFAGTTDGKIFKCTSLNPSSGTDTWTAITPSGNNSAWVRRIVVDLSNKNIIYACYSGFNNANIGKHIYRSTNQGTSWSDISTNLPDIPVHSLVIDPINSGTVYIGTETGVYQSTDTGVSWNTFTAGMPSYVPVDELVLQTGTNTLFAFTHGRGVWKTTSPLPVELSSFNAVTEKNNVHLDWRTETEINNYGFEVEKSITDENNSSENLSFSKIAFVAGNGSSNVPHDYSYTDESTAPGNYVYRLKQIDSDGDINYSNLVFVKLDGNSFGFELAQNYPNPFNPTTQINYKVSEQGHITIKVFSISGEEITTLVNENKNAGLYNVKFDGSRLPSGVYIYQLKEGKNSEIKKMILLK